MLRSSGYPAYTTSPGWLGYSDAELQRLAREAVADGFTQIKLKVGASVEDDVRRMRLAREAVGPDIRIAVDANQRWDVGSAVEWMKHLAPCDPYWIEEPTSPDDILGHARIRREVAPIKVATGEHVSNRVIFKQLLQAGAVDVVQIDAARVGGINENIAILLLAAKFGVPVCPTPAVSDSVRWCSTSPCSTSSPSLARPKIGSWSMSTICTNTSSTRYGCGRDATWRRQPQDSAPRCNRMSLEMYGYPDGRVWAARRA